MKKAEYLETQNLVLTYAQLLDGMFDNIDEFIQAIKRAETAAPVTDPTLYMKGKDNLQHIKRIAKAMQKCRNEISVPLSELIKNSNNEIEQIK